MNGLAIERLKAEGTPSPERIDHFLRDHHFPLVEGGSVTFAYRGQADAVLLQHFIYGLPTSQPFARIDGSDLWYLILELPRESSMQYKLNVIHGDDHNWILDPLNSHRALDPYGANSVCHTEGIARPDWTYPDPVARPGDLIKIRTKSRALGHFRDTLLYLPARFRRSRRYPLLLVHDGSDYLRFADIKTVFDNLIHRMEVAPMIIALTNSPDRLHDYADNEAHARYLVEELMPRLERDFPIRPEPAARGLMGASFGGVACLSTAWRYPGRFGRLLLQSGSFAFTDIGANKRGPAFEPVVRFVNAFRQNPGKPSEKVFVSCGTYETLIYENRSMVPLLQSIGMDVKYVEARDSHNWENWRDRLREGLSWLFPGPLWMVYE
jgi:enterochelin esterase-like enzyme